MSHECCIWSCEAKISSLSMESTYRFNLPFSSCLHLRTMCSLSLILRMTMILEWMFTIGFVATTHVDVSRNYLENLDVDQTQGSNQRRCTTMFRSPRFKERGASRYTESWQSCCSCSRRLSSDLMGLLTIQIAPITCRNYAQRFCIGDERCLTGYHQVMSSMEPVFGDTWTFSVSICRPIQLKNDESQLPCMTKTQLGHCFVVCCLAHGDEIGNERMDMINAPQAPECHITAELWLHLATC